MEEIRITEFQNDLIDDLSVDCSIVTVARDGKARYKIDFTTTDSTSMTVHLWTTEKDVIAVQAEVFQEGVNDSDPLVQITSDSDGCFVGLNCSNCGLHLEQWDRGLYGFSLENSKGVICHIVFKTNGYIKAKLVNGS